MRQMKSRMTAALAVAVVTLATAVCADRPTTSPTIDRILFTKALSDGSQIEIHESELPTTGFGVLYSPDDSKQLRAIIEYRAELHPKMNGAPATIWSTIQGNGVNWAGAGESHVLDLYCKDGKLLVVLWSGGQLWVYYSEFGGLPSSGLVGIPADWTIYPTFQEFDPKVTKATFELQDGRIKLHVVERNGQVGRVTDFEKLSDKWEFQTKHAESDK